MCPILLKMDIFPRRFVPKIFFSLWDVITLILFNFTLMFWIEISSINFGTVVGTFL